MKLLKILASLLGSVVFACIVLGLFISAVLQQSYREYPPTQQELEDNPALVSYLD